jgi:hypothetical protein
MANIGIAKTAAENEKRVKDLMSRLNSSAQAQHSRDAQIR